MRFFWPNSCECILPLQGGNSAKLLVMPFAQKNHFAGIVKTMLGEIGINPDSIYIVMVNVKYRKIW